MNLETLPVDIHSDVLALSRDLGLEQLTRKWFIPEEQSISEEVHQNSCAEIENVIDRRQPASDIELKNSLEAKADEISMEQIASGTRKRKNDNGEINGERKKKRRIGKAKENKGLRHFSAKVCQKVEEKKCTTYNEVADELVGEFAGSVGATALDQKNIRRRVYDALNVLMAMNIISRDKKDIIWRGLPTDDNEDPRHLEAEKQEILKRIGEKKKYLEELNSRSTLCKSLLARNSRQDFYPNSRIFPPFIIVHTKKQTIIDLEMSEDRTEYFFDFSLPFSILDDEEIFKKLRPIDQMETSLEPGIPNEVEGEKEEVKD